jgi:hypothetical protein
MSRKAIVAGVLVLVIGVTLFFAVDAWSGHTSALENQSSSNRLEAELLVLRSDGFHPNEITRRPGRFLLALQNHSSEEDLSLVLKQESGASLRSVNIPKRQSKLKEFLDLPPGRYVLMAAKHPDWICTITITSH